MLMSTDAGATISFTVIVPSRRDADLKYIAARGHTRVRDILVTSGRGAAAKTACKVPAIAGGAPEGVCRRNRRSGSAAGGWGRGLNPRHCHPGGILRVERYRDSGYLFVLTLLVRASPERFRESYARI